MAYGEAREGVLRWKSGTPVIRIAANRYIYRGAREGKGFLICFYKTYLAVAARATLLSTSHTSNVRALLAGFLKNVHSYGGDLISFPPKFSV